MLESSRLILRSLTTVDADDLLEYQSNPDVIRFIPWPVRDREMVAEAITKLLEFIGSGEPGLNQTYAMELKSSGKVIGQVNYMFKDGHDFQREIGYVINPAFGGQGYVHEALVAMVTHVFDVGDVQRVYAKIDARNTASEKVARRLGMRKEAHHIRDDFFKGEWTDSLIYAILKSEWAPTE
jgi:RimJ/RimL family protein N-acetyltransferase